MGGNICFSFSNVSSILKEKETRYLKGLLLLPETLWSESPALLVNKFTEIPLSHIVVSPSFHPFYRHTYQVHPQCSATT